MLLEDATPLPPSKTDLLGSVVQGQLAQSRELIAELAAALDTVLLRFGPQMPTEDQRTRQALVDRAQAFIAQNEPEQLPAEEEED